MESRKLNSLRDFQLERLASIFTNQGILSANQWTSTVASITHHFPEYRTKV